MITHEDMIFLRHKDNGDYYYADITDLSRKLFRHESMMEDATDISDLDKDQQLDLMAAYQHWLGDELDAEIVRIKRTTEISHLSDNDQEFKELSQHKAILKLSERDVRLLSLEKLATYLKTKFG